MRGKASGDAGEVGLAGLGADLDQSMRGEVADELAGGRGDEFAEHGPEGGGGGEVGAGALAHARALRDIITEARRVERGRHETREGHHAVTGLAPKQGDEGVVSGGGFHGTSVAGTFRLRQTKRG